MPGLHQTQLTHFTLLARPAYAAPHPHDTITPVLILVLGAGAGVAGAGC
jgi:hypothetical protein